MRALHFCKNPKLENGIQNVNRIYKIEPVLNYFNNRINEVYQPSTNLSLDESMVLWRGRLLFRQYIKNKRHKYGVKLYMTHTEFVVEQLLLEDHFYKGHSLFMDNYYNSVNLAHKLLEKKTYCTGTLRSNGINNPKSVIEKKIQVGESICNYMSDGVCVVKWKDRREVLTISSEFKGETVEATNRRGTIKMKTETVVQYNRYKKK
ncbi:piggyBac transposable element-derived protein 4-like [Melanaphis sacchari]|uniref:piggyBac transposable element-derived protein 4-like n=1 Tax=Melanaphis sacchari TaxID=742174 RepID=UPI000DC15379|nr:piggyBac transposable element-derived protein 4-like [Melanaphis sacchari]